ncbi:hypothetical protein B0T26DRAFT_720759 [Lasiosphaeria miniovina]|uniref:Uncharacterized protein n=1 Tax=Lasiosphaeria miniovina TaxID=1954250 RepID=A0AA40A4U5_9PEZI|nr:uncharacterized protein B0T26DRAFT_720759 [Lasiosphaeria miniovina]KAK0709186.1 hypothetical protein B0T26DRAFT_720759 [Lasiosphaeria miniovina]
MVPLSRGPVSGTPPARDCPASPSPDPRDSGTLLIGPPKTEYAPLLCISTGIRNIIPIGPTD